MWGSKEQYWFTTHNLQNSLNYSPFTPTPVRNCPFCNLAPQTHKHVLNNCSAPAASEHYKVRQNAAAWSILCSWLSSVIEPDTVLHAVFPGSNYKFIRREPYKHKSRDYKRTPYTNISEDHKVPFTKHSIKLITWELISLSFVADPTDFDSHLGTKLFPDSVSR